MSNELTHIVVLPAEFPRKNILAYLVRYIIIFIVCRQEKENKVNKFEEIRYTGDAEEYLLQIPMFTKEKHSLEVIREILKKIGRIPKGKIIHIAGTNGKGSVCAFLSSVLMEAGYKVGTFTSPHLQCIRERIAVNGRMISPRDFEHCFRLVLGDLRACMKDGVSHPAFFEFLFYMAMVHFYETEVDYIILETGMGGRLDATNICSPAAAVITSVSMDHTEYLGNTLEAIAGEKAGIIKENTPVIFAADSAVSRNVIEKRAKELSAPAFPVVSSGYKAELMKNGTLKVTAEWQDKEIVFHVPFPAVYQGENAILALRTLEVLRDKRFQGDEKITDQAVVYGMEHAKWPGRMEQILPGVYLDGAHNPDGILKFTQTVKTMAEAGDKKVKLLFSVVGDKEYDRMAETLCRNVDWAGISITHINNNRGLDTRIIETVFKKYALCPVKSYASVAEAFKEELEKKKKNEMLFCAGSLYFVGEIKEALKEYGYH